MERGEREGRVRCGGMGWDGFLWGRGWKGNGCTRTRLTIGNERSGERWGGAYVTLASLSGGGIDSVGLGLLDLLSCCRFNARCQKKLYRFSALRSGDAINRGAVREYLVLLCIYAFDAVLWGNRRSISHFAFGWRP